MKVFLLLFLFTTFTFAQERRENPFKKLTLHDKNPPYIIKIILQHLQSIPIEDKLSNQILLYMVNINKALKPLSFVDRTFLITSEGYKSFLNYLFLKPSLVSLAQRNIQKAHIVTAKEKLHNIQSAYSSFAQFIINEALDDFTLFLKNHLLEEYQSGAILSFKKRKEVRELKKRIKYSGPWIHKFLSTSPANFNKEMSLMIEFFFKNLSEQSKVFSFHTSSPSTDKKSEFFRNLNLKRGYKKEGALNKKAPQVDAKKEATQTIKSLDIQKTKSPSVELDKLMKVL